MQVGQMPWENSAEVCLLTYVFTRSRVPSAVDTLAPRADVEQALQGPHLRAREIPLGDQGLQFALARLEQRRK
jgi:hypothetical protein